jgi:hypothetical protein
VIERDREDALVTVVDQRDRGPLEPEPLDECEQRLVGDRPEDAMEMKRREGGDLGETLEREVLGKVVADVVDDPVDTLLVLETTKIHNGYDTASPRRATASHRGSSSLRTTDTRGLRDHERTR